MQFQKQVEYFIVAKTSKILLNKCMVFLKKLLTFGAPIQHHKLCYILIQKLYLSLANSDALKECFVIFCISLCFRELSTLQAIHCRPTCHISSSHMMDIKINPDLVWLILKIGNTKCMYLVHIAHIISIKSKQNLMHFVIKYFNPL